MSSTIYKWGAGLIYFGGLAKGSTNTDFVFHVNAIPI